MTGPQPLIEDGLVVLHHLRGTQTRSGGGYAIGPSWVVSASNWLSDLKVGEELHIVRLGTKEVATLMAVDLSRDCALLRIDSCRHLPVPVLSGRGCSSGAACYALAWDVDAAYVIKISGQVMDSGAVDPLGQHKILVVLTDSPISRLAIGGAPIISDGEIIGHVTKLVTGSSGTAQIVWVCPVDTALDFLAEQASISEPPPIGINSTKEVPRRMLVAQGVQLLHSGKVTTYWGPDSFGKSTILRQLLKDWGRVQPTSRALIVPVGALMAATGGQPSQSRAFALGVASTLAEGCGMKPEAVERAFSSPMSHWGQLSAVLKDCVRRDGGKLLLVLDRADAVVGTTLQDSFFGQLRSWIEKAAVDNQWKNLRLVMAISSSPNYLNQSIHLSPFNVGVNIKVDELSVDEIIELGQMMEIGWDESDYQQLVQRIGGHPLLVQTALEWARKNTRPAQALFANSATERAAFVHFIRRLREQLRSTLGLSELLQKIAKLPISETAISIESLLCLERLGAVIRDKGTVRLRAPIFEHVL